MSYLLIGSGDVGNLLMGLKTKGYADLWRKFLSEHPPYYNAFNSPIDALRTGAILEDVYSNYSDDVFYSQVKVTDKDQDIFRSSLDFAKIENGEIVDFEELKTIYLPDYIEIIKAIDGLDDKVSVIKKKFNTNYNQVQFQLKCTGLDKATLVFLSVETYDDEENKRRILEPKDYTKFEIPRDEEVISKIRERGEIFQLVKNNFLQKEERVL
jgi:hypothetical protein